MLKIAWSRIYNHPLPENHRFPMIKYDLLREQLLYDGTITEVNLFTPDALDHEIIQWTHDPEYLQNLLNLNLSKSEIRKTGFPLSKALIDREIMIMGGTIQAANYALENGVSMNIAGGTHHAFRDRGEGFCLLNDLAITANYLLKSNKVRKVLIIDLDVHQGNGTASIFEGRTDVFTFSMHGGANYPLHKENSHLDVPLEDGISDDEYLKILALNLNVILKQFTPDFVIYQCGVDILLSDKLGRLGVSINGCKERDRKVFEFCQKGGFPIVASMGGGYSSKLSDIINAHANTFRLAQEMYF